MYSLPGALCHVMVRGNNGPDMGRTNISVNILLSLEPIKHTFDYTDEILLDQYNLNFQIMYALGMRNLGERCLADRTFYNFRRRVYEFTIEHPEEEDLVFSQFEKLAQSFCEAAGISTKQQRMDSTFVMSNIKLAVRLSYVISARLILPLSHFGFIVPITCSNLIKYIILALLFGIENVIAKVKPDTNAVGILDYLKG